MFTVKRHGSVKETGPMRNPKITALLDEIINDTPDDVDVASQSFLPTVAVKQTSLHTVPQASNSTADFTKSIACDRDTKAINRSYS